MITQSNIDRWIQRATLFTLLALAALLLAIGVVLYAPSAHAAIARNILNNSAVMMGGET